MNHLIQLEEKLDSIEFGSQKKFLKLVLDGNEAGAKHVMRKSLGRRRKALENLYDKGKGNVVHEVTKKLKKQEGGRSRGGFTGESPAKTMAQMRKLRAHKSRDAKAAMIKKLKKQRDVLRRLATVGL